ncbi:MAG: FadR/GntR family transcriptional regulator, partial [Candidatus Dormibacteraceae bacterium]
MTLVVLQEEVKQLILDRRLQPGDPLPTESELMVLLRVGRNSVRETLKSLQALDLVEIRHGYGTFVGSMSLQPLTDGLTFRIHTDLRDGLRGLRELLEIREELEAALIRKVTPLTGEDELRRLREALDAIDAAQR